MKFRQLALGLLASASLAAPAFAHNTATAIACVEPGDSSQVRSGFVVSGHSTVWTGAVSRSLSDEDESGVGVRIDTQTGNGAFRLQSSSSEFSDPFMFYVFGLGRGETGSSDSGIFSTEDIHGNILWSFNGLPHGYKMVSIYFVDFGESDSESFQDVVFPPTVVGGPAVPVGHGYQSDCSFIP